MHLGPLIMGLPLVFDAAAAHDRRAVIQFRVGGDEPGGDWVRIADGRCESFEGTAPAADLAIHTSGDVWVAISSGRLDGAQALLENRYRVEGSGAVFTALATWFGKGVRPAPGEPSPKT
jgi:putative sterol carrier protein